MKPFRLWMLTAIFLCGTTTVQAQAIKAADLEKYTQEKYGDKWLDAAKSLAEGLTLDKNESLTYQQVIPAEGKKKEQLYVPLNYWTAATFPPSSSGGSAITLNDKEAGCIIITSTIPSIVEHMGTVTQQYSNAEAAVSTLQAGADIVLGPQNFVKAFDAVVQAVEDGVLTEQRINQSVRRILKLKKHLRQ